ncbi:CDP-6-deoxy-L-threo-D-glycero-4-hexulose-3-dehydrase reductase [Aquicella siphonis]|uniref:CDP-6-deoxy-L-threo-D-glycero-4-hexulose-3-dehydrase reductase n=1 Tax=Aquicella siphonis TaxID=254247 RepID=A0A5E4PDN5_9COXI|nr:hypothetical protein [Aquicella siphonis]VVC75059.1 CDP-6-deoxy-L-threo-D-glycero-4-hexulose-3-dehydrase reductase [Aquicella siphonis]
MSNTYFYEVIRIQTLVGEVSQIFLEPGSHLALSYEAGQYVNVLHRDQSASPLSIACAPFSSRVLEFHLFHPPENHQARDLLQMGKKEKSWRLTGPFGDCTVGRLHPRKPLFFIARGTGFASVKAVIEALSQAQRRPPMHLYWSMPLRSEFYLENLLEQWAEEIDGFGCTLISRDHRAGKADSLCETLIHDWGDLSDCQIYASGSPSFVNAAFSILRDYGLQRSFFYSDVVSG